MRGQVGPSVEKSRLLLDCADGSRRKGVLSPLSPLPRRGQRRGQLFSVQLLNDLPAGQVRHVVLDLSAGPPAGTGTGLYRARELSLVDHPVQGGPADAQQFTDFSRFQQLGCGIYHPFPPKKPQPRGRWTNASPSGSTNQHPEDPMPGCSMSGYSTAGYSMIEYGSWRSQDWKNPRPLNWSYSFLQGFTPVVGEHFPGSLQLTFRKRGLELNRWRQRDSNPPGRKSWKALRAACHPHRWWRRRQDAAPAALQGLSL